MIVQHVGTLNNAKNISNNKMTGFKSLLFKVLAKSVTREPLASDNNLNKSKDVRKWKDSFDVKQFYRTILYEIHTSNVIHPLLISIDADLDFLKDLGPRYSNIHNIRIRNLWFEKSFWITHVWSIIIHGPKSWRGISSLTQWLPTGLRPSDLNNSHHYWQIIEREKKQS